MATSPHDPLASLPLTELAAAAARGDPAALGIRVGTTVRAMRERATRVLAARPPATFPDFPAVLDALLPEDDTDELDVARAAGTTVGALRMLQGGLRRGIAGVPPEVVVRLARMVTLDLPALRELVRRDPAVAHDGALARAVEDRIVRAWDAVPA